MIAALYTPRNGRASGVISTNMNAGWKWNSPPPRRWPKWARCRQKRLAALRAHAGFELERIQEIEREVRHDVIAFTTAVAETMKAAGAAEASRWLHYGLTSNDVVDTAQALQIGTPPQLISRRASTNYSAA